MIKNSKINHTSPSKAYLTHSYRCTFNFVTSAKLTSHILMTKPTSLHRSKNNRTVLVYGFSMTLTSPPTLYCHSVLFEPRFKSVVYARPVKFRLTFARFLVIFRMGVFVLDADCDRVTMTDSKCALCYGFLYGVSGWFLCFRRYRWFSICFRHFFYHIRLLFVDLKR